MKENRKSLGPTIVNKAFYTYCMVLCVTPAELSRVSGLSAATIWNWLHDTNRTIRGRFLPVLVKSLRELALDRSARGLPSLPPEAITVEALCSPLIVPRMAKVTPKPKKSKLTPPVAL